jgi:hypothetical protein
MKITTQLPLGPMVPGRYHQVFMGAGRSVDERMLAGIVRQDVAMGLPGVILHFGPRRAVDVWKRMSRIVLEAGLLCGVSLGVDGHEDDTAHHHDVLTAREKGECLAEVANDPNCAVVGVDAEPAYDPGVPSADGAIDVDVMCARYRELAPHAFTFHQSWWKRRNAHPRFPFKRFALMADAVFPQPYFNNADVVHALGRKRYDVLLPVYESEWSAIETEFRSTVGADDPRGETFQGYGWDDIPYVYVRESLRRPITINWGEPEISAVVEACNRGIQILIREGHYDVRNLATAETAVRSWQNAYNAGAVGRARGQIKADGSLGYESLTAMGVW